MTMCNCGKPPGPNAIWMVNPEKYFCTCRRGVAGLPATVTASQIRAAWELIGRNVKKPDALRPSEV